MNSCGSGISSTDSRYAPRSAKVKTENLAGPVRPCGLQGHPVATEDGPRIVATLEPHAKPRQHPVLENFEQELAVTGVDSSITLAPAASAPVATAATAAAPDAERRQLTVMSCDQVGLSWSIAIDQHGRAIIFWADVRVATAGQPLAVHSGDNVT